MIRVKKPSRHLSLSLVLLVAASSLAPRSTHSAAYFTWRLLQCRREQMLAQTAAVNVNRRPDAIRAAVLFILGWAG